MKQITNLNIHSSHLKKSRNLTNDPIKRKILNGSYKIAIYGLGHVGAPIAAVWLRSGATVIGIDKSKDVISNALNGRTHIPEPGVNEAFNTGLKEGRFFLYNDFIKASSDSYLKMICVPVLAPDGSADLTAVKEVTNSIGKGLKKNAVISLNPSVPPGTTEDVIIPIIEKVSGLKVEKDFFMIYNPERIYEGRAIADIEDRYPAIVSGYGQKSLEIGKKIFSIISKKGVFSMSNLKSAEAEKLFEGVYRDVNIALANELAKICENLGINFWEIKQAANSQPFCHLHSPGIGVGGACIPVYPQFIIDSAKKSNSLCDITKLGRKLNNSMPSYCVQQALKLLPDMPNYNELVVTLLGLAFRGNVADTRLSPTYAVIKELNKLKIKEIRIHDPLVKSDNHIKQYKNTYLYTNLQDSLKNTNLIILIADHDEYKKINRKWIQKIPFYDGRGFLTQKIDKLTSVIGIGN